MHMNRLLPNSSLEACGHITHTHCGHHAETRHGHLKCYFCARTSRSSSAFETIHLGALLRGNMPHLSNRCRLLSSSSACFLKKDLWQLHLVAGAPVLMLRAGGFTSRSPNKTHKKRNAQQPNKLPHLQSCCCLKRSSRGFSAGHMPLGVCLHTHWTCPVTKGSRASRKERCASRSDCVGCRCKHRSACFLRAKGCQASAAGSTQAAATLRDIGLKIAQSRCKLANTWTLLGIPCSMLPFSQICSRICSCE